MAFSLDDSDFEQEIASLKKQLADVQKERDSLKNSLSRFYDGISLGDQLLNEKDSSLQSAGKLLQRGKLLQAVSESMYCLLTQMDSAKAIEETFITLGIALDIDRVYLFENHVDPDTGELLKSQRYEWCSNNSSPQISNPALQNVSYKWNCPRWYEVLSAGKIIKGLVHEFPDRERIELEPQGIRSLLVVPILIDTHFWGFIGFDDCRNERIWDSMEETILAAVAGSIGNVLIRKGTEEKLQENEERLRTLINAIPGLVCLKDQEGRWLETNEFSRRLLGLENVDFRGMKDTELAGLNPFYHDIFLNCNDTDNQTWSDGQQTRKDEIMPHPDGLLQIFDIIKVPMFYPDGRRKGLVEVGFNITERKKAEEELRATKEFYQVLCDSLNDAVFVDDAKTGKIIYVNRRMCEMYGYNYEEALTVAIGELSLGESPYSQEDVLKKLQKAKEKPQTFEWLAKHRSGKLFWVEVSLRYARIGKDERYFVTVRDISERKQSQDELRKSEERFRILVESSPNAIMLVQDSKIVFTNSAGVKMLGFSDPAELIGYSNLDFIPLQYHAIVKNRLQNVMQGNYNSSTELELYKKDGSLLMVESVSVPTTINGKPSILIINQDISQRKEAEMALRESERRFRDILETVHLVAVTIDVNGDITFCNDYLLGLTGWEYKDVIQKRWVDLFVPENDRNRIQSLLMKTLSTRSIPIHYEYPLITRNGEMRNILWDSTFLLDKIGGVNGLASLGRDITEKNQLEEQLRHSQKMEAIGQLAGGIAHDFNNLLMGIIGYSEILLDNFSENDPAWEGIQEIKKAGERAAALTRQLLAFSRRQVLQPEIINLNSIISELEKMLRRLIGENIALQTFLECDLWNIKADPGQVEQVIVNLVVNARDAMPQGGRLIVKTSNIEVDEECTKRFIVIPLGDYVMMEIIDSGTGIAPENQIRIFDPFFTTKKEGKGTGLGLSTVYGIVQQSGGQIYLESQVGLGSNFIIMFPQCKESTPLNKKDERTDYQRGSETILIVEDEDLVRTITAKVLKLQGYKILQAATPAEALLLCEQYNKPIHLLITDIVMPQMNGRELSERVQKQMPSVKVLFMSGYTDDQIIQHGVFDSELEFLQKPFSPTNLTKKVRHILDHS